MLEPGLIGQLYIESQPRGPIIVFALHGSLDRHTAPMLARRLDQALVRGSTRIVLDFARSSLADMTVLRGLAAACAKARAATGGITLANVPPAADRAIRAAGLGGIVTVGGTVAEACEVLAPASKAA